ncbi:MAG: hypothetical protein QM784_12400 [Polyangiaceae bacterium]
MDIYLDRRAVRQIRLSAQEAVEEGDLESLREDILDSFTEEQVEEIERRLDSGDCSNFSRTYWTSGAATTLMSSSSFWKPNSAKWGSISKIEAKGAEEDGDEPEEDEDEIDDDDEDLDEDLDEDFVEDEDEP